MSQSGAVRAVQSDAFVQVIVQYIPFAPSSTVATSKHVPEAHSLSDVQVAPSARSPASPASVVALSGEAVALASERAPTCHVVVLIPVQGKVSEDCY